MNLAPTLTLGSHSWRRLLLLLALCGLAGCASAPAPRRPPARPPIHLAVVRDALSLKGIPYRWGEETPERGFDCSGFVQYVFGKHGVPLPRTAYDMAMALPSLNKSFRQPGDLVFFNTMKKAFSHVGIYMGDGKFIHAPRTGKSIRVDDMRSAYWQKRFNGARRVQPEDAPDSGR